jgi:rhamnose utilization protein RhaD (predicted bifunctional aldolase and dehydrogenase)/NAD(P)-dependent dehydrogenase (short-subunit alcohol dehydrogenase family)
MKSRWSDDDARAFVERYATRGVNEDLALRTYSSRLLGADPRLVLHGGGNTSVKTTLPDMFGNPVEALCVKGSGWDLAAIEPQGHSALRLAALRDLRNATLNDEQLVNYFRQNLLDTTAPNPSIETLTHAYAPHKFVDHTHAVVATAIGDQPESEAICRAIYGERVAWMPYVMPGFDLSIATAEIFERFPAAEGMLLANHGLFTYAATAKASYELMIEFVTLAEEYIAANGRPAKVFAAAGPAAEPPAAAALLPRLRAAFGAESAPADRHWLFDLRRGERISTFVDGAGVNDYALRGVATPEHVIRMKRLPLVLARLDGPLEGWSASAATALRRYIADYDTYFAANNARVGGDRRKLDPLPRVIVVPGLGVIGSGRTAAEASISADVAEAWIDAIVDAESIGRYASISEAQHFDMEYWSLEQVKLGKAPRKPLAGRVAVVTGGGSGIGAATARAFAAQGAEVAVVDIAADAAAAVARGFKGLPCDCDVTDMHDVRAMFETVVTRFGGVDILVSNAGAAWTGMMADIDDAVLRKSFELNFFAHQNVASAAVRIMREQRLGGVLLFNVSKQAVNPGANFGAYGTSKAALLALVRQYALEHGAEGIRANAINADRIRSGLLTDAFIAERARARGVSEAEYMGGNLLGREVLADDVAQAFVTSALLEKTTGNVTTVDGGNVAAMLR